MKIVNLDCIKEVIDIVYNYDEVLLNYIVERKYNKVSNYLFEYFAFELFKTKDMENLDRKKINATTTYLNSVMDEYTNYYYDNLDLYEVEDYETLVEHLKEMLCYIYENHTSNIVEDTLKSFISECIERIFELVIACKEEEEIYEYLDYLKNIRIKTNVDYEACKNEIQNRLYNSKFDEIYNDLINDVMNFSFNDCTTINDYINDKINELEKSVEFKEAIGEFKKEASDILKEIIDRFIVVDSNKYKLVENN